MKRINPIYGRYTELLDESSEKEFLLQEQLNTIITTSTQELLSIKPTFKTDVAKLISNIQTKYIDLTFKHIKDKLSEDKTHPKYNILEFKIRLIHTTAQRLNLNAKRLKEIKQSKIPYSTFHFFNSMLNEEIAKSILRGYAFDSGVGQIKVEKRTRQFDEDGHPKDKIPNWEESNKFKQTLIDNGVELYNEKTNPNGRKWLLYHTEPTVCYINWYPPVSQIPDAIFFKFEPTSYINTVNRVNSDVLDVATDVEDIIQTDALGLARKLALILKFNPAYAENYPEG